MEQLSEKGQQAATKLIEDFKKELSKAAENAMSDLYCNILPYIETDSWTNFRSSIISEISGQKGLYDYELKQVRRKIFEENRDEIVNETIKSLEEENARLKKEINDIILHRH